MLGMKGMSIADRLELKRLIREAVREELVSWDFDQRMKALTDAQAREKSAREIQDEVKHDN